MRLGLVGLRQRRAALPRPVLEAARGIEIAGVVARAEATRAAAREDLPGVPIHASLTELLQAGVDAVTITTPPQDSP
jgi:predicted dehydrogenase